MSPEQPSTKIGKSVGEKLRAARVALHYTQSQLAAPDFSVSYISAIERGQIHPSLRALEILAARLGLSSTQLLPQRSHQEDQLGLALGQAEQDEEEIELALLEAHILIYQNLPEVALTLLDTVAPRRLKHSQQLHYHYLRGLAYNKAGRFQESEYMLTEAEPLVRELNLTHLHVRILTILAQNYSAMHNNNQALQTYQRSLLLLEGNEHNDPFSAIEIYTALGQHYTRLNNFEQALEAFDKALQLSNTLTTRHNIQATYTRLSQYFIDQNDFQHGTLFAYKSTQMYNIDAIKHLRSNLHHYLGHAIMQQDPGALRAYVDQALQQRGIELDPLTLASLMAHSAEWYITQQLLDEAEKQAQQAVDLSQPLGDSVIGAEALITLGHVAIARQQLEQGCTHIAEGLNILERLGSHEELADESVNYAELLESLGKEREAFTYFRRAFQSRQKVGK